MTSHPHSQPDTIEITPRQKFAIRKMGELERQYGRKFLCTSLHQVRFDYQALERVAKGIDP